MSVPLFSLGAAYLSGYLQNQQPNSQTAKGEFQQLGQDLQAGNLTQAQQDYNALMQDVSGRQIKSVLSQDFTALGQALQSGNLSSAQQAYSKVQQDVQQIAQTHHRHHHHASGSQGSNGQQSLFQEFSALGQALQSGNLSVAQQAYSVIQQAFQQFGLDGGSGTNGTAAQPTSSTLSVAG